MGVVGALLVVGYSAHLNGITYTSSIAMLGFPVPPYVAKKMQFYPILAHFYKNFKIYSEKPSNMTSNSERTLILKKSLSQIFPLFPLLVHFNEKLLSIVRVYILKFPTLKPFLLKQHWV